MDIHSSVKARSRGGNGAAFRAEDVNLSALAQCYFILGEPLEVAKILKGLLARSEKAHLLLGPPKGVQTVQDSRLLAYQIGFDIVRSI